ncbi:MAG: hypothetical protein LAO24_01240 [Acidobacteriia bacterium]|nr:hypothetical protein [Terriglobia bacterium]
MPRVARAPSPARRCHRSLQRTGKAALALLVLLAILTACGRLPPPPVHPFLQEPFPEKLSDWHLFVGQSPRLQPNQRVIPYDLNTPLFSDYASKYRFVWMPPGTSASYRDDGVFDFPVGTVLAKSFAFPVDGNPGKNEERLIETRLLVHSKTGWIGLPYIWNESQTEAHLDLAPDPVPIRYTDSAGTRHDFTYFIPNANECKQCHENNHAVLPIGPKGRNLNKNFVYADGPANQLAYWTKFGYLQRAPAADQAPKVAAWNDPDAGTLDARARAYLDNNCAHCHQPGGTAGYTGIDLRVTDTGLRTFGVCKSPNSSGRVGTLSYDLVPGHPEQSILLARMTSIRPKEMMPQIGRSVVHEEGVALIRDWIQAMPVDDAACARNPSHPVPGARSRKPGL